MAEVSQFGVTHWTCRPLKAMKWSSTIPTSWPSKISPTKPKRTSNFGPPWRLKVPRPMPGMAGGSIRSPCHQMAGKGLMHCLPLGTKFGDVEMAMGPEVFVFKFLMKKNGAKVLGILETLRGMSRLVRGRPNFCVSVGQLLGLATQIWSPQGCPQDNNYRNMMRRDLENKGEEYVRKTYPARAKYCIPILVDPQDAYDVSVRPTPEMVERGVPPGYNLKMMPLSEPGMRPRMCITVRIEDET